MKPEQFIRELGLEKAREVVEDAPDGATLFRVGGLEEIPTYLKMIDGKYWRYSWRKGFIEGCQVTYNKINDDGELVSLSDLKRLVESLDLIKSCGGIDNVKDENPIWDWPSEIEARLPQAIRDHESIYGGGDA